MAIDHDARTADSGTRRYEVLDVERDGHVATVFLDRPEKRNAMGEAFFAELPQAIAEVESDDEIRAVVIAAKGPHFTVGLDLTALAGIGGGEGPAAGDKRGRDPSAAKLASRTYGHVLRLQASISAVADCSKPVIAVVHGYCIGGGIDLISACDIRICSARAIFSVRETRMAIVADLGTLQRLPQIIPMGHLSELVYTGKDIDADRAERIGLVNEVHPDGDSALAAGRALAAEIAANSPLAVQGSKAVLAQIHRQQVEDGLRFVAAWNAGHLRSHDLTEAVSAFMEKRPASFEGN
jgi:enoyl-CoA hydratase